MRLFRLSSFPLSLDLFPPIREVPHTVTPFTMTRLLTALAFTSFGLLSGCDMISPSESVQLPISSIQVSNLASAQWDDDGTGPDVLVEIQSAGRSALYQSGIVTDVDDDEVNISLDVPAEIYSRALPVQVAVFDNDSEALGEDVDEMARSALFTLEDLERAGDSITFDNSDIRITLQLDRTISAD